MKNCIYNIITSVFLIALVTGMLYHHRAPSETVPVDSKLALIRNVFPDATSVIHESDFPPHYKIYRPDPQTGRSQLYGLAFMTTEVASEIQGYGGPIDILIGIDPAGHILDTHLVSHHETTTYTGPLDDFLIQFVSLKPGDNFILGKNIQGITGATITSTAITQAIAESLAVIADRVLKKAPPVSKAPAPAAPSAVLWHILFPVLLFGLALWALFSGRPQWRWLAMLISLGYLGLVAGVMVSAVDIANVGLSGFPDHRTTPLRFLLIGLAFLSALLLGRLYCSTVCPFAAVQEILYNVSQKITHGKKLYITPAADRGLKSIKYIILIVIILLSLWLGQSGPAEIEAFLTFFSWKGTPWAWGLLFLTLIVSCFHRRFWCRYLCPTGAFLGLGARMSIFKIRLEPCQKCQRCSGICPTDAISHTADNQTRINPAECVLCGRCLGVCPNGKIRFFTKRK